MPPPPEDTSGRHHRISSTSLLWRQSEGLTDDALGEDVDQDAGETIWRLDESREVHPVGGASPRSYVALALGIFIALLLLDGLYVGFRLRASLRSAGAALQTAEGALVKGDVKQAAVSLATAQDASNVGAGLTLHPSFVLASWLPGIGRDVRSFGALSDAAELSTDAGHRLLEAVKMLGLREGQIPNRLYRSGRVRFRPIDRARPLLSGATRLLAVADSELAAQHAGLGTTRSLLSGARASLNRTLAQAQGADQLVTRLPSLLGRDNPRRYLMAFQALGEARGTGGVIGLYGIMSADHGRLSLTKVGYLGNLIKGALPSPARAPQWFQRNYGPQFATRQWQQVNLSPNFPVVGQVVLNMYQAATGVRLDGVVAMDPVALQDLIPATGPVKGPGMPVALTATNAARILLKNSYIAFPTRTDQNRYLAAIVHRFWQRLTGGELQASGLGSALREATITQHLKMYSRIRRDQGALAAVGATGDLTAYGSNLQMIFNTNYSANKVDYFLRKRFHITVRLEASGDAEITDQVRLHNYASKGPPSPLLGPGLKGDPPGMNRMVLNFLVPPGARHARLNSNGHKGFPLRYQDSGRPLFWTLVSLPPGQTKTETFSYRLPSAAQISESSGVFRFVLYPQATAIPDWSSVRVIPPPGWTLTQARGVAATAHGDALLSGYFSTPETIQVQFSHR